MADISTLHDDFEDGVIDPVLWATVGSVTETGGRLVLTPTSSGVTSYAITRSQYDLSNSQVTAQIPVATAIGLTHSVQCALAVSINNDNTIALRKTGATIYASTVVSGTSTDIPLATYDSTAHLYWRIRADSSNIYWETSASGVSPFFIQYTQNTSSLFDITSLYVWLYTVYTGVEPAAGSYRIEEINPGQKLTFSGASLSAGQLRITQVRTLTFSGASSSAGSLSVTIPPLTANQLTGTAASVSTGSLALIKLAPSSTSLLFAGSSTSFGSLTLMKTGTLSFFGQSFSTAHLTLTVVAPSIDPALVQYFIFEPPVVYDRPGVHAHTPRRIRREMYYYAHSLGPTGQSVLKLDGQYQTIYTPTTSQISSATKVYQGGHIYTIPQSDADELVAAGYSVTPILTDITAPVLNILSPYAMANVDQIVRVLLTTSEPSSLTGTIATGDISYALTIPSTAFTINLSALPDGVYRITLTATDVAGNATTAYVDINIIHQIPIGTCLYPLDVLFPSDSLFPLACP